MKPPRWLVCVVALIGVSAMAQGSIFPSKQTRKLAKYLKPSEVTAESRAFLKGKMSAHGSDLRELSMAVATLNYELAQQYAQGIANQPRLDPDAAKAAKLPPSFVALQDNLRTLATELVDISANKDSTEMVTAYAHLVQTCASCHQAFEVTAK